MNRRFFVSTVLAITIGCGSIAFAQTANHPKDLPCKPVNLGLYKDQLTEYEQSGRYSADLKAVDDQAMAYLTQQAKRTGKLALVLDIDETALSNWEEIRMNDYGRFSAGPCFPPKGPCGWTAWIDSLKSMAIEPTLELYRQARGQGLAIFFITGRHEHERTATETNLRAAGYDAWAKLFMEPEGFHPKSATDFKAPVRKTITGDGYSIILNVGDQMSDLDGGYAEKTFKLPNPFYYIP